MGHGGNIALMAKEAGVSKDEFIDFSANINPLGPPSSVYSSLVREGERIIHYPEISYSELLGKLAIFFEESAEHITVGNGSNELLFAVLSVLNPTRVVLPVPCYYDYFSAARSIDADISTVFLKREDGFVLEKSLLASSICDGDVIIIGRPNNPTGKSPSKEYIYQLLDRFPKSYFIIDEAFIDLTHRDRNKFERDNLILLRSLTKSFAIPGIRLGALIASSEIVKKIREKIPSWSVNCIAQGIGERLFEDEDYLVRSRELIDLEREYLVAGLKSYPTLEIFPGDANYILVHITNDSMSATFLKEKLLQRGIGIRSCEDYIGLDDSFFRIAIKTRNHNQKLLGAMSEVLVKRKTTIIRKKPSLMFQGTCSDAGKSILTTAFCRILKRHGISVAPFKAQNMSLNSYVTHDGLEMGRAQVTQAFAAKLSPDVRMNPVLLKPNSDTGSQVILKGKSIGNRNTIGYIDYKKIAFEAVKESYDSLSSEYDAIILEGAGSPGEINLKKHDIVNMRMAQYANSPVLLVGDIDRGGVFASFIGTYCTLETWEKELLKGFVVNKFRGDRTLLGDVNKMIRDYTNRDIYGTVDYLKGLFIPDEDSVSFKGKNEFSSNCGELSVGVIDLPHISNATDIDPLIIEPDVNMRKISSIGSLSHLDLVVIPGSKNVIGDLNWIKSQGLDSEIQSYVSEGGTVVGICGGLQILGKMIRDPYQIEGTGNSQEGIGILDGDTTLEEVKTTRLVRGVESESRCDVSGYEIHHGDTSFANTDIWISRSDGAILGVKSQSLNVYATYLHGVFDSDSFRRKFLNEIRVNKFLPVIDELTPYDIEKSIERLADHVEEQFDMNAIYKMMGL